ncbi:MAG TPA: O-antigen ligase family protein [Myxococcaceae bacterium]|nr:O-antigen ligase family protein [Myxococcaceae bacterium]
MSDRVSTLASPPRPGSATPRWVVLGVLVVLTAAAVLVGNGNLGLALVPALAALAIWLLWTLPLRATLLTLLALAWAVESPSDVFASGRIHTPWAIVGRFLWAKLNLLVPFSPLVLTGFDLVAVLLLALVVVRHFTRSPVDREGWVPSPVPLGLFAWLTVVAVLLITAHGLARGGSFRFVLWQAIKWLYVPLVYTLMNQGLRGPKDAWLTGQVLLGAGVFRALEAVIIRLRYPSFEEVPHTTSHHDSVLFATCLALLGARVLEAPSRRASRALVLLGGLFLWAMVANNRRLVWTELAMVTVFFWLVTPWRPLKRRLARLAVLGSVPALLYLTVGWNSGSRLFSPVQKIRSIVDSKRDASTAWRDMENFNLVETYRMAPVTGLGFGHPMVEAVRLPDVTAAYELEPYVPHNSVLGLWAFGGLLGFALLWAVFPVGMFFTARAYRWARDPVERITALGAAAVQICYVMQGYGDLGFGTWGPVFTVAAGYALVGKICVARGAWPLRWATSPADPSLGTPVAPHPGVATG